MSIFLRVSVVLLLSLGFGTALADEVCQPSQEVFTFFEVMEGMSSHGYMDLTNNSDEPLWVNVSVESDVFRVNGMHRYIEPWETVDLHIWFEPNGGGYFEALIDLGNEICPQILVRGTGLERSCDVSPATLDFGSLNLGETSELEVTVTNDGEVDLPLDPSCLVPGVGLSGFVGDLPPGQSATYTVSFTPSEPGIFSGSIGWGAWYPTCEDVTLTASVGINMNPGEDRLGVFFDEAFTELMPDVGAAGQFVTGYLVLSNPSDYSGVSAWECQVVADAPGYILSWDFAGQAINAGQGNNLVVGLGGDPLPYGETIELATFQMYVAEEALDPFGIRVMPVAQPTIPGAMAYIPGAPESEPLPLLPFTGIEVVAWVTATGVSGVPVPEASGTLGLHPNVPNPFNPSTSIRFELEYEGQARVQIHDLQGRLVRTLVDEIRPAGLQSATWNGRDNAGRQVASGAYYVRLSAGGDLVTRKIMLLK